MYRDRRAAVLENADLRVTVLEEGGHIAEIFDKRARVNPLWTPSWPSIEPSTFNPRLHTTYGAGGDARLLAGIMGHNLCLDIFGGPSPEEAAAGLTPHGEASVARYELDMSGHALTLRATYTFLDTEILSVDSLARIAPPPFTVGDPLIRRPRHQAAAARSRLIRLLRQQLARRVAAGPLESARHEHLRQSLHA